jgi:hypothetical protein
MSARARQFAFFCGLSGILLLSPGIVMAYFAYVSPTDTELEAVRVEAVRWCYRADGVDWKRCASFNEGQAARDYWEGCAAFCGKKSECAAACVSAWQPYSNAENRRVANGVSVAGTLLCVAGLIAFLWSALCACLCVFGAES